METTGITILDLGLQIIAVELFAVMETIVFLPMKCQKYFILNGKIYFVCAYAYVP